MFVRSNPPLSECLDSHYSSFHSVQIDWNMSRCGILVTRRDEKEAADAGDAVTDAAAGELTQKAVPGAGAMRVLRQNYRMIMNTFRHYVCQGKNAR